MIASTQHQSWLFYLPLGKQVSLLKDDLLDPVDKLLDDPALIEFVRQCLAIRFPQVDQHRADGHRSRSIAALLCAQTPEELELSRPGTPAAQQLHLPAVHALRRRGHARFHHLQPNLCLARPSHRENSKRVVGLARQEGAAEGHKLRTDTTAVETNVHFPTDSTLLGDGIRVLSRSLKRIATECQSGACEVVNHGRAVKHRLLEISRAAKSLTETVASACAIVITSCWH